MTWQLAFVITGPHVLPLLWSSSRWGKFSSIFEVREPRRRCYPGAYSLIRRKHRVRRLASDSLYWIWVSRKHSEQPGLGIKAKSMRNKVHSRELWLLFHEPGRTRFKLPKNSEFVFLIFRFQLCPYRRRKEGAFLVFLFNNNNNNKKRFCSRQALFVAPSVFFWRGVIGFVIPFEGKNAHTQCIRLNLFKTNAMVRCFKTI